MKTLPICLFAFATLAVSAAVYPDADWVVVNEKIVTRYDAEGCDETMDDESIRVLTERGRRQLSTVTLDVSRRYGDAAIEMVEIIGVDGTVRIVDFAKTLKEATDNGSTAANIYDPLDRRITCAVPDLAVGETRRVVTRCKTTKARMKGTWADFNLLESTQPVEKLSIEIETPAGLPLAHVKIRHPLAGTVSVITNGNRIAITAANVPQAFAEPDMPPMHMELQSVLTSTCKDWPTVSRWYHGLCEPHLAKTSDAMRAKTAELVENAADDAAKIRAVFKFVSQEVRYMGLTLEDDAPGYEPHDVDLTFANRYGVCRDKAALLVAMLRLAGLDAYPVLISAGAKMDPDVPLPFFNHAIVGVRNAAGGFDLMDPTNEATADLFPAYLGNCSYLVATPQGEKLAVSPVVPPSANTLRIVSTGETTSGGEAFVASEISFGGINDTAYRHALLRKTDEERRAFFAQLVSSVAPGAELLNCRWTPEDLRDTSVPLSATLSARYPALLMRGEKKNRLVVPWLTKTIGVANFFVEGNMSLEKRRFPLVLDSTAATEERVTLRGDVFPGGVWTGERKFALDDVEYAPDRYTALREELKDRETRERADVELPVVPDSAGANVRVVGDDIRIDITGPRAWTTRHVLRKEVLTYKGKKSSAELKFSFNPSFENVHLVSATVSNRDGRVSRVTEKEMNVLDAGWVGSAPRYPASKTLVVNLPSVEIGSVIDVCVERDVNGAPAPFQGMWYFDSFEDLLTRTVSVYRAADGGLSPVAFRTVDRPVRLASEPGQPNGRLWREACVYSDGTFEDAGYPLYRALIAARRRGSREVRTWARALVEGVEGDEARLQTIRKAVVRRVRRTGPGVWEVPFHLACTEPDRCLTDGYASPLDYANVLAVAFDAVGFDARVVLSDGLVTPALRALAVSEKRSSVYDVPLVRVRTGGLFSTAPRRTYYFGGENEYTPLGTSPYDDTSVWDPSDDAPESTPLAVESDLRDATVRETTIDVRENGAVDIEVEVKYWGAQVGAFRKRYEEMTPEIRDRHYRAILGGLAQNATATGELETDTSSYPAVLRYKAYIPGYAVVTGDTVSVTLPGFDGAVAAVGAGERMTPFGLSGTDSGLTSCTVVFPAGYTRLEHLPAWFSSDKIGLAQSTTTDETDDGRLSVRVCRTREKKVGETVLGSDYASFLRDWNARAASKANRTIILRR